MLCCCSEGGNTAVPKEYRIIADRLFSPEGNAGDFAKILGVSADYVGNLEACEKGIAPKELLVSFQNNIDLLIQKTWVEKSDESRKEALQDRLPALIKSIETEDYRGALEGFGAILEELAYLFFGVQSQKEDFTEYTFRIDAQVGLFWWYGGMLGSPRVLEWAKSADKSALLAVLLLGICYLTNF